MIKLKYAMPFDVSSPEINLMMAVFQTGLLVHNKNKFEQRITSNVNIDVEIDENSLNEEA